RRPYTADVTSVLAQSTSVAPEPGAERQPPIYLDYNASTPLDPAVAEAMEPFMRSRFGNPSSAHEYGATARVAVERARAQVARLLGAHLAEIVFNSSGSEATNLALKRLAFASRSPLHDLRLITSAVEHPATIETCRFLERLGCHVTVLPSTGMESLSSTRSGRHFANPRSRSGTSASSAAAAATSPPAFPRSPPRPARACHDGTSGPSSVLEAMGLSPEAAPRRDPPQRRPVHNRGRDRAGSRPSNNP